MTALSLSTDIGGTGSLKCKITSRLRMYYRSGTDVHCCRGTRADDRSGTFLREL